jgi:excisionase family DNA binding protein
MTKRQSPLKPEMDDDPYLTVAEIAERMRCCKMTVYRLVHSGDLESVQFGKRGMFRVRESVFRAWIKNHDGVRW